MPIVKEPKPLPSPLDYVPQNSVEYVVTRDDSWDLLAQRPEIKNAGVSSYDLCFFNFKTREPGEINWYLYHKVGCRHTTRDTLNYVFTLADDPGIIYLPKLGTILPVHQKVAEDRISADQLMIYSTGESAFPTLAEKFEKESPGNNKSEVAKAASELKSILNRYEHLKQINFYTHGNVGYVYFTGGGISTATVSSLTAPHDELFDGQGRVLFVGCNVGEGPDGRTFLLAAGRALLKGHGGFVGATTSMNIFGRWGLFDPFMPLWGDLRVIQLDANGNILKEQMF
jgi:hypothetical protein